MKTKENAYDLTQGNIWKQLLLFCLPILAGSLFQQLYSTVDAIVVGQFAGKNALASIDAVYNLTKLPVNFFIGLSSGATIIISQYFGAKKLDFLSKTVHTAIALSFAGGLILSITGIALTPYFLQLLKIPDDIYIFTLSYTRIYFSGMLFLMIYNIGAGIMRAIGESKTPFYYLIIASITNIVLDLLFVGVFKWHVAGAAFATVISQLVSALLILRALIRTKLCCKIQLKKIKFYSPFLMKIVKLGLPISIQAALYPIANMIIQSNINQFGTDSIAAWAVCGKLDFLIWLSADALGMAVSTFTAQNIGAGNYNRAKRGVRICVSSALILVGSMSIILYIWCEPLGRLFINDNTIIELSTQLMHFLAPLYCTYIFGTILSGAIKGAGETLKPMLLTLLGTCACRILWVSLIAPRHNSLIMVLWSYPVSWIVTSALFIIYYQFFKEKNLKGNLITGN